MLKILRKILPTPVKKIIRQVLKLIRYTYRKYAIKHAVQNGTVEKIIVGAAETYQKGRYSTNEQWLDITNKQDWQSVFKQQECLTHVVAEHVFEHLHHEEAQRALEYIYSYLKPGGRVRIAVPDGNNPDPDYIRYVGINGIGDDAADHKQLLTSGALKDLMEGSGFQAQHIEGYDEKGQLLQNPYHMKDGFIMRSRVHKDTTLDTPWSFPDAHTSLIVDGIKPLDA